MDPEELVAKEQELSESLFRFRLRRGTNQLDSPAVVARRGARSRASRPSSARVSLDG